MFALQGRWSSFGRGLFWVFAMALLPVAVSLLIPLSDPKPEIGNWAFIPALVVGKYAVLTLFVAPSLHLKLCTLLLWFSATILPGPLWCKHRWLASTRPGMPGKPHSCPLWCSTGGPSPCGSS